MSGEVRTDNGYAVAWSLAGFLEAVKARAATAADARASRFLPLALYASTVTMAGVVGCEPCANYIRDRFAEKKAKARKRGTALACMDVQRAHGWPIEVAEHLMERIDPRQAYDDWFKVGAALHRTWGTPEAFEVWRRWSQSDPEHVHEPKPHKRDRGLEARWRDFERDADRDGPTAVIDIEEPVLEVDVLDHARGAQAHEALLAVLRRLERAHYPGYKVLGGDAFLRGVDIPSTGAECFDVPSTGVSQPGGGMSKRRQ